MLICPEGGNITEVDITNIGFLQHYQRSFENTRTEAEKLEQTCENGGSLTNRLRTIIDEIFDHKFPSLREFLSVVNNIQDL